MDNPALPSLQQLQRQNSILRGFLCELLIQTQDPVTRGLALKTVKKLQAVGVRDLDALLDELL